MNYTAEVLKLEPTAKIKAHGLGDAEWTSITRAPHTHSDEIVYLVSPRSEKDVLEAAYCKLKGIEKKFETNLGPGGYDYPSLPTGVTIL